MESEIGQPRWARPFTADERAEAATGRRWRVIRRHIECALMSQTVRSAGPESDSRYWTVPVY
jgi:hypothetical protein